MDALEYQIKLIDQMSGPAKTADAALGQLQQQLKADSAELRNLQASMRGLQGGTAVSVSAFKQLEAQIAAKKNSIAGVHEQLVGLGAAGKVGASGTATLTDRLKELAGSKAQEQLGPLSGLLEDLGPEALAAAGAFAALAAAAVALAVGFGAAVLGGAKLAVQAAEAKQDTLDLLDAMLGSQEAAQSTYKAIEGITQRVAISQERATTLARELSAAGVDNEKALTSAIESIGKVESVLGPAAGSKIQSILEKAAQSGKFQLSAKQLVGTGIQVQKLYAELGRATGKGTKQIEADLKAGKINAEVGIAALTKVLDAKFAGPAAGQILDIGAQLQRLKDNFMKLFEDVNTGPFLEALNEIGKLFSQDSAAGAGMKTVITSFFNGFFKLAAKVLPYVTTLFKGLVIIGLRIFIALKPLAKIFGSIGGAAPGVDSFANALDFVSQAIAKVVGWVVIAVGWLAKLLENKVVIFEIKVAFITLGLAIGAVAVAGLLLVAPFLLAAAAIVYFLGLGAQLIQWIAGLGAAAIEAGSNFVSGLVTGIVNGAGAVIDAVKNLGKGAKEAFTNFFGIHSDSKLMMQLGRHIGGGLTTGIDLSAPAANDAMLSMVEPPPRATQAASRGSSASASGSVGDVTITINISGVAGAAEIKEMMPALMADVLEQAGLLRGAAA